MQGRANCANGPMSIERLNPTPRRADWDKGGANAAPISRSYAVACCNRRLRQADFAPKLLTVWKIKDEDLLAALHVRNPKLITCKLLLVLPLSDAAGDSFANLTLEPSDTICISALPPFALMNARSSSKRLRARFPRQRILVGLWSRTGEVEDFEERLTKAFDVQVVTSLTEAVQRLTGNTESETEAALSARVRQVER